MSKKYSLYFFGTTMWELFMIFLRILVLYQDVYKNLLFIM